MAKNEIIVGRQVEKGDYLVEDQHKSVSRKHCCISRKENGIYIEDMNSANGTFVNGKSVSSKKINHSDRLTLGGADGYELKLAAVLKLLPVSDKEFRDNFLALKQVYENYQKEKIKIQANSQTKRMLKQSLPMMAMRAVPIVGGLLSAGAGAIGSRMAAKDIEPMLEKMNALREQFMLDYVCPNCNREFGERPWENIKRQGKCPACQREFHIED
jgi:DNA-directed RNA polymerase subunit RPC12/RpoP